jgi:pilus assembly protein CpaB
MRVRGILLIGLSLVLGVFALLLVRGANSGSGATTKVVVAKSGLSFGERITLSAVHVVDYPKQAVPVGAFGTVESVAGAGEDRIALRTIVPGEPLLVSNITGKGGRGTLSNLIADGMRAITIAVNDVRGVAGFVHVSDRVDVLLTRNDHSQADVLLQNIKVLAVDQQAGDEKADKPAIAKAVTLEVSPEDAQKLALGIGIGNLSLALRNNTSTDIAEQRSLSVSELTGAAPVPAKPVAVARAPRPVALVSSLEIVRGTDATSYRVKGDGAVENDFGEGTIMSGGSISGPKPKQRRAAAGAK